MIRLVHRRLLTAADLDATIPGVVLALLDETGAPQPWACALRSHPDPAAVLPGELAQWLARHPHLTVRRAVAYNQRTPPSVLTALATGVGIPPARRCAGCDGSAKPSAWTLCAGRHETALVDLAYALVTNPVTPPATVASHAEHDADYVRLALAERPDLPQHTYRTLAEDRTPAVRGAVAENPAIDELLTRRLAGDDTYVRRRLAHNPTIPLDVLAQIAPITTKIGTTLLPRIGAATPDEIDTLARSPIPALRMLLAERPHLPPAVVNLLADDPDAKVLKSLARTASLTDRQLRTMVARHGVRVIAAIARNPVCGPQLLHELAAHTPPVPKAIRAIAAHPNTDPATLLRCLHEHQARSIAAGHPALPAATITDLLNHPDQRVVQAAAANPSLPHAAMRHLFTARATTSSARRH